MAVWDGPGYEHPDAILSRSLCYVCAWADETLVEARTRGAHWLHVDFEPHLTDFYRACGFAPTAAGLIRLR
jgi:hypothetical protein